MPGESLRDQLQATYDALSSDVDAIAPAAAPAPAAEPVESAAPAAEPVPAADGAPARDEQGRFAPKDKAQAAEAPAGDPPQKAASVPEIEPAKPADKEAPGEPIRVPQSLPAAIKARFATLDPDVQQAFVGLEESVQKAKAEWSKKGERLNRFDEIMGPRLERWRLGGLDEFSGIQILLTAQDMLERNPIDALQQLARSYGVNLAQVAQQMSGGQPTGQGAQPPGQPQGFDPNALQPLIAQALTPLQQRLDQLQQQTEAEKQGAANQTVSEFANRPENLYWEDVKQDVAWLLQNGRASTLQDAYDKACWSSDTIRPLLIQAHAGDQQREAAARAQAQQRQAADRARSQAAAQAAGSVTGAPQGAQAAPASSSSGNLRQDLEAAWSAAQN